MPLTSPASLLLMLVRMPFALHHVLAGGVRSAVRWRHKEEFDHVLLDMNQVRGSEYMSARPCTRRQEQVATGL